VINATDAGLTATGATGSDYNVFDSNQVYGGYIGITNVGATTANAGYVRNNQFTNNTIADFYFAGIQLTGTANTLIEGNRFTRPNRGLSPTSVYGVYATGTLSNNLWVNRNRFFLPFGGTPAQSAASFYGVAHNAVDAGAGNENRVTNNLF
jgi:trimeric autotransporter adhesin